MLDDLLLFVILVDNSCNFSALSHLTGVQQSTVSKRINKLESKLNQQLLVRHTKKAFLTDYGKFIYEKFKHLNSPLYDVFSQDAVIMDDKAEDLNVFLPTVLSYKLICPYLDGFVNKFPSINLNTQFSYGKPCFENGIDVAVTKFYIKDDSLSCQHVRKEFIYLYCTPAYAAKHGIPNDITQLKNHRLIVVSDDNFNFECVKFVNSLTQEEFVETNFTYKLKINSILHMREIALHSSNYIFGSWKHICQENIDDGSLIQILPQWYTYPQDFYLISKHNPRPVEQVFINFIHECMKY